MTPVGGLRRNLAGQGLVRPRQGKWIGGVCAGLARRLGTPPIAVRGLFVVSIFFPGPQFVVYLVLWALMPSESQSPPTG